MRSLGCRSRSSQVDGIGLNFSPFLPVQRHSIHLKKKKGLIRYVFLLTGKLIHVDLASSLGLEIPVRVGTVHAQSPSKQQKYRYPIGRTDPRLFRGPPRFFHKKRRHRTSIKSKISRYHGGLNSTPTEVPFILVHLGPRPASSPKQAIGEQYTMRESTCPRRRALAASTAAVLLLCSGQPYVAEALTITTGGAPSALRMTTVASTGSRGSVSHGARRDANIGSFHGNGRWKSAGASSPLFSSGTSFVHRHNALVGAAGSRQHADASATRLHASSMVRYTLVRLFILMRSILLPRKGAPRPSAYLMLHF